MTSSLVTVGLHGFTGCAGDLAEVADVRLALVGHSPELPVPAGHDFAAEVARLAARLAEVRGPVHLIGYSMGGRLALAIALDHPALVARLTVVGAHPGLRDGAAGRDERDARRAADARWIALLARGDLAGFVAAWEAQPLWDSQRSAPPERLAAQRRVRLAHDPRELAAALASLGLAAQPDLGARLATLAMPTAFVAGALDAKYVALAERSAAAAPRARAVVVADAGHNPFVERAAAMADIIRGDAP